MANWSVSFARVFILAIAIRIALLLYGEWQDNNFAVKYTDVDYYVYTDAARFVVQGQSPYLRATYRYTPILAFLLTPNMYVSWFGKVLFAAADLVAGLTIHSLLQSRTNNPLLYTCLWLFNPLVINMSSRGSADGLFMALLFGTLWLLENNKVTLAAVLYGLCVHFRIYPVIHGPAFVLYLSLASIKKQKKEDTQTQQLAMTPTPPPPAAAAASPDDTHDTTTATASTAPAAASVWREFLVRSLTPQGLRFFAVSAATFFLLAAGCFALYGEEFLQETYFYHFGRKDNRHNFSIYFYHLYLRYSSATSFSTLAFLPQVILSLAFTLKFYHDLAFCVFLQTYCFVVFNKVCTAQYFLWYLGFIPLIAPRSALSRKAAVLLCCGWALGETHWLAWAYRLEFLGQNTFLQVWLASVLFFAINVAIIATLLWTRR